MVRDMRPLFTSHDRANSRGRDAKHGPDLWIRHQAAHCPDLPYLVLAKLCRNASFSPKPRPVLQLVRNVLCSRRPSKVAWINAVADIAGVCGLHSNRRGAICGFTNDARSSPPSIFERDHAISVFVCRIWPKKTSVSFVLDRFHNEGGSVTARRTTSRRRAMPLKTVVVRFAKPVRRMTGAAPFDRACFHPGNLTLGRIGSKSHVR